MTDQHSTGRSPSTRTDVFRATNEAKIRFFHRYCHEQNVDFFAYGGDWGDSPYLSQRFVRYLGEVYEEEQKGKDAFGIFGNHDMMGWNPNTMQDTSLGLHMHFQKNFTLLSKEPIVKEYNGQSVALSGVSSHANLDRDTDLRPRADDYIMNWKSEIPLIHIVHGFLSPKPILDDILHTTIDEIRSTDARFTLTGHDHTGFNPIMLGTDRHGHEKWACNPGAMSRVFASHSEMNRMPQFLIGTINDDGSGYLDIIQFTNAKPGHEVMDRTAIDEKKKKEEMLEATRGTIKEVLSNIDVQNISLDAIVLRFKEEVEPNVYNETVRRLKKFD